MVIFNLPTVARPVDGTDFSDITTAKVTGPSKWVAAEELKIPFERDLTDDEKTRVLRRLMTRDAAEERIVTDLLAARASLKGVADPIGTTMRLLIDLRLRDLGLTASAPILSTPPSTPRSQ